MNSEGATGAYHREDRVLVRHLGTDAIQAINRAIADASRLAKKTNPDATPAPGATDVLIVEDLEAKSSHMICMHRLDFRPRSAPAVCNLVAFSKADYAATRTDALQLATPAYYRKDKSLAPGIGDQRDGTLTKDATGWAKTINPSVTVTGADLSFASQSEPWVYCAAHYCTAGELRRLKKHFADEYGYEAATRIADADAFARLLGIEFAVRFDKARHVKPDATDDWIYVHTKGTTNTERGAHPIDTFVRVYHGPVHYTDRAGRVDKQEQWFDPDAGPKAWFTKKTALKVQREYRFAINTPGEPVEPKHYISVSPDLRALTSAL